MGVGNVRVICPRCGAKIATQHKRLGRLSLWANSWLLVQTGTECPECGVKLTGKVKVGIKAELAPAHASPLRLVPTPVATAVDDIRRQSVSTADLRDWIMTTAHDADASTVHGAWQIDAWLQLGRRFDALSAEDDAKLVDQLRATGSMRHG